MIDDRKIKILQSIINDYIITGEPIGSRTIAKKYDLGISSATIRNEMADLEEMGYLEQPHTSAGRIPSSRGYRLYVDKLMEKKELSLDEELFIKSSIIDAALYEVDKIVRQATSLLSELTKLTCVVKVPSVRKSSIKSIQLIKVDEVNLLCVIITDTGIIKNSLLRLKGSPSVDVIEKINSILNYRLKDLTIEQINLEIINKIKMDLAGHEDIFNSIIPALYETLNDSDASDIFMEGTTNIFNYPEYNDIEKAKEILSLLNNKEYVSKLIKSDNNITIRIGDENFLPEARDCSVISAIYSLGDRPLGTIGLIGPRRINYSKVISIMSEVIKELNESLSNQSLR
ncbi:heat-inducible transcriptional repressor HrcA [Clostridium fallax]|uniref:Heat-inducible transcription repressor HrcA n=1 Tax=Clostridium fallax TaxID=1533 RepID=A0A1M4UGY8_9CLOT|nr:heat-inducible transcription repressor HrcA [Clostridium fallax]SQB07555.1 heat-inducible transcription repressor HrcA [Clostridium fallax]